MFCILLKLRGEILKEKIESDVIALKEYVEEHGSKSKGKTFLLKHLKGENLTLKQAVLSHCYECGGFNREDCQVTSCSLYKHNPYSTKYKAAKQEPSSRSDKQKENDSKLKIIAFKKGE